jgi:hypothetical protein
MEIYKRKVGYEDLNYRIINSVLPITASSYLITATTLYFPVMLTQNFEDIGLYTDTENPVYEIVDFSGIWNLSNTGGGVAGQTPCLILNNCNVSFTSVPITYYNANNGSISALITGCPGPQTIQWTGPNGFTNSNLTINSLASGNYTLKITDANCNISYASYFLTQPQSLSAVLLSNNSQTNVTSPGGCNGSANVTPLGGQPPYTYTWYSFTPPSYTATTVYAGPSTTLTGLTSLCAGQYSVQIKDASNTIVSQFFTITEPTPISGKTVSTVGVSCAGGNTGALTVLATGGIHPTGYTFVLSGPVTGTIAGNTGGNATFSNLLGGNYNVQIFDNVGNTTTVGPINITSPSAVNLSVNYKDVGCFGNTNGFVTFTPSGGVSPYTITTLKNSIVISNQTTSGAVTLSNLGVGTYQAQITDTNGCVGPTQTVTLKQRPLLNVSVATPNTFNGYNIRCFSATTAITVTTSYTSDSTTYTVPPNTIRIYLNNILKKTLSPGPGTTIITGLTAGNYTVTAVDSATAGHPPPGFFLNCSATTTVTLTQPPMPLSIVGGIDTVNSSGCVPVCTSLGYGGTCVQGIINVNGGVGPYTVTWFMTPGNVGWGTGITSNPFCTNMGPYTTLTARVVDANGCTITSSINV